MSLLVLLSRWNLSECIKAESYKQKERFFSCLCYQAANISQKPRVCFAFVTIPLWKNVHKRSVCSDWGSTKSWVKQFRRKRYRAQSWVMEMLSPAQGFAGVCPHGGFRSLIESTHCLACVPFNIPSQNRYSLSLPACPCWHIELSNWEPVWAWEGFYICRCFEKVQLASRGLHGRSVAEL